MSFENPQEGVIPHLEEQQDDRKFRKPYTITRKRENWTQQEHRMFLIALKLYERDWKKIESCIKTKTVVQIRSHAQKYFLKMQKQGNTAGIPPPRPRRRSAFEDVHEDEIYGHGFHPRRKGSPNEYSHSPTEMGFRRMNPDARGYRPDQMQPNGYPHVCRSCPSGHSPYLRGMGMEHQNDLSALSNASTLSQLSPLSSLSSAAALVSPVTTAGWNREGVAVQPMLADDIVTRPYRSVAPRAPGCAYALSTGEMPLQGSACGCPTHCNQSFPPQVSPYVVSTWESLTALSSCPVPQPAARKRMRPNQSDSPESLSSALLSTELHFSPTRTSSRFPPKPVGTATSPTAMKQSPGRPISRSNFRRLSVPQTQDSVSPVPRVAYSSSPGGTLMKDDIDGMTAQNPSGGSRSPRIAARPPRRSSLAPVSPLATAQPSSLGN